MNWLAICLIAVVVGNKGEEKIKDVKKIGLQRNRKICNTHGYQLVEGRFGKETYWLCLTKRDLSASILTSQNPILFLDPEAEHNSTTNVVSLHDVSMAFGFPVVNPSAGSAEGYIGEDHHFYGVLHLEGRILHADPYGKDNTERQFGAFENDYGPPPPQIPQPRSRREQTEQTTETYGNFAPYFNYRIEERKRIPGIARARICDLLLLADMEFFVRDAHSNLKHVVQRMIHAVAQADIIFRNADFDEDGIPDNIGFAVKYILVLTSEETNSRVFGDLLRNHAVDGRTYLMKFARLRRLSEVCLGVAFSGHAFHNRTLGLSFTSLGGGMGGAAGGLCDRRAYGRSFNTLALAHATTDDKERVPQRIAGLTLAHEMGHSFGAHHDDNFPNPECKGYLMGSQSSSAVDGMNFEFSICSKRLIATTLMSMSYCLTEVDKSYCGNGIVEEGEACDCGLPSRCSQRDPCCTPRAGGALVFEEGTLHKEGCSVAPSAKCHPSQGLCCNDRCKYVDLTRHGIDCIKQQDECTCHDIECRCGLGGRCLSDGTCHSVECAKLDLKECQCMNKGVGGVLSAAGMCGICCELPGPDGETDCVGAETAARAVFKNRTRMIPSLLDEDYKGPNITFNLCVREHRCINATLRAWPAGGVCLTRGQVGVCSPRAVCKKSFLTPRSNVFPHIMASSLMEKKLLSATSRLTITFLNTVIVIVLVLICS